MGSESSEGHKGNQGTRASFIQEEMGRAVTVQLEEERFRET